MTPIVVAIRERLLALPDVAALVAARIYTLQFPQSMTAPAIRLMEIDRLGGQGLRGEYALHFSRVEVDSVEHEAHANPYGTAHAIADAVHGSTAAGAASGLAGFRGVLSGITVESIALLDEREIFDEPTRLIRVAQDYRVAWQFRA